MIKETLPESIKYLSDVIGLTEALAIVALRGGSRISIHKRFDPDSWILEAIRKEPYEKLITHYSGENIEISTCAIAWKNIRNIDIINDFNAGLSKAELAMKHGFTDRGIRKLLARYQLLITDKKDTHDD
ncbi:MAG: hypothetical protein HOP23_18280 [Methylococcaceae bacterium]|nr:hypothetical protein [Methylococcaceae bacterium]